MRPFMLASALVLFVGTHVSLAQIPENKLESQNAAKAIIEKAIKAHGGESKLARMRQMRLKLNAKAIIGGDSAPFTLDVIWDLPRRYRSEMKFQYQGVEITRTVVINGNEGWITLTGMPAKELSAKDLAEAKEQMYAELVCKLLTLRETGYELRGLDETKIDNRPMEGVNVVSKGRREVNLYFDKATGLLSKMEHVVQDLSAKEASQEVLFAGYRDTSGGPKHWSRLIVFNDRNRVYEAEMVEIRYLDRLDDRLFAKPPIKKDDDKKPEQKKTEPKK